MYNATRVAQQVSSVIHVGQQGRGSHCFFVAENKEGEIKVILLGCLEQHFFSDSLVASLIHYDVLPGWRMSGAGLRLMSAFLTLDRDYNGVIDSGKEMFSNSAVSLDRRGLWGMSYVNNLIESRRVG